jgi:hypothetical protein
MSAARTEKSRPSDTSFNAGVNPVLDKKAYLEEKAQPGQVPPRKQLWPGNSSGPETTVIPAQAGIQWNRPPRVAWVPACAGMTKSAVSGIDEMTVSKGRSSGRPLVGPNLFGQ